MVSTTGLRSAPWLATRSICITSLNQPILYINGNSSSAHRIRWWQNLDGFTMFMIDGFSHSHPNPLHPDPLPSRRVGFFCSKGGNYAKKYAPAIVVIERNRKRVQNFFLHTSPLWRGLRSWASRSWASRSWASRSWASRGWASRSRARKFGNITYSFVFPSIFLLFTLQNMFAGMGQTRPMQIMVSVLYNHRPQPKT